MDELRAQLKAVTRITIFFLSLCMIGWVLFPHYRGVLAGLILGTGISLINAHYLSFKVKQFSQVIIEKGTRRMSLGFITRIAMVLLAVMAAMKLEQIEVSGVLVGICFVQLAVLVRGIITSNRQK